MTLFMTLLTTRDFIPYFIDDSIGDPNDDSIDDTIDASTCAVIVDFIGYSTHGAFVTRIRSSIDASIA